MPDSEPVAAKGADAFESHQDADRAQYHDVDQRDGVIDLADPAEHSENHQSRHRAQRAAGEQDEAHAQIDVAPAGMRDQSRDRGSGNVTGFGAHRHGRRNADQDQEGRGQEPSPETKHARKDAGAEPDP